MTILLPPLLDPERLTELFKETAGAAGVAPEQVEKDFYLTRLLWAVSQLLGDRVLLKGGTLLTKVDLGFFRMSEDADYVLPEIAGRARGPNMKRLNVLRDALRLAAPAAGMRLPFPSGEAFDHGSHRKWSLEYDSSFGPQGLQVEASMRPALRPARKVTLRQLVTDPAIGNYDLATCWALDANEARAEKVRAAFTREAIRDYYDLERLADTGADFTSSAFIALVDAKLAELDQPPLASYATSFGLTPPRRKGLEASLNKELESVLRSGAPKFNLDATLARFDRLWRK